MRERGRHRRVGLEPSSRSSSAAPRGKLRRRWPAAVIVFAVAGASAVYWTSSRWREELPHAAPVEPEMSAAAVPAADLVDTTPKVVGDAALPETHEALIEEVTRLSTRVVEAFPHDPLAYDLQGRVHSYLGNSTEAARAWERCLQLDERRPDACQGLASLAIKRGDDATAEPLLRRALDIDVTFPEAAGQLAELLMRTGRAAEAASILERYVQQVPSAAGSLIQLGQIQLQLGDFEKARANFQAAIDLQPASSEAYLGLGTALLRQGERDKSREYLDKSRELRSQKPSAPPEMTAEVFDMTMTRVSCASVYFYAARVYHNRGDLREAETLARRAAALDPKNLRCRLFLITLYQQMNRLDQAVKIAQETVAADPENPDLLWRLGVLSAQIGRLDVAETALKDVIRLAPKQARGYAGLAEVYLESRRHPTESLPLAREAVRLSPDPLHYVLLARIHAQAGDFPDAVAALDQALRLEPDNPLYRQLRDQFSLAAQR